VAKAKQCDRNAVATCLAGESRYSCTMMACVVKLMVCITSSSTGTERVMASATVALHYADAFKH